MRVIQTERLQLRWLSTDDAEWIHELVNDPDWLRHIGDRGVRTVDDARRYLQSGPIAMYSRHGHGLYAVELRADGTPIGICGLLRRDTLDDVDLGFALLPRFRARGYAREAAAATLDFGRRTLGIQRIVAIVAPGNHASCHLLESLGMRLERLVRLAGEEAEVCLFGPTGSLEEPAAADPGRGASGPVQGMA